MELPGKAALGKSETCGKPHDLSELSQFAQAFPTKKELFASPCPLSPSNGQAH
jgi:hypothetical protein